MRDPSGLVNAIEAASGASKPRTRSTSWQSSASSRSVRTASSPGSLKTLTLTTKLQFVPETNKSKDSAPDFRIYLDKLEVGAAWKKVGRESGREYWSVKLDDQAHRRGAAVRLRN